jgi:predicted PurR-regulated permease PerM
MEPDEDRVEHFRPPDLMRSLTIDIAIRIGLLVLLAYWSLKVIGPFVTILLWSGILTVALYPVFNWLARVIGSKTLAAATITMLSLMIVLGPVTWLGFAMIGGIELLVKGIDTGQLAIPMPPEAVRSWPLIGEKIFQLWSQAASNTEALLLQSAPYLKDIGATLLNISQGVAVGLLEFVGSIVIAGFLYIPGPRVLDFIRILLRRILGHESQQMLQLIGSTIRNVARGVVGIALLQSLLAGIGFIIAGIPAAGLFTFLALVLGIIQIGPSILIIPIVIWSWMKMEPSSAVMFTAYMIPVSLADNILRPIIMARGLSTPMPVILVGVIGGMIAYGISGLFVGPIVLAVLWALIQEWAVES